MSRELKFRVWSYLSKSFEYFDIYQGANLGISGGVSEPQQFTGMLDKNGVEIYEGDIILCKLHYGIKDSIGIVHYFGSGFIVDWRNQVDSPLDEIEDFEVIGNIFENKDLICDHMKSHISVNGNCYNCGKLIFPKK